MAISDDQVAAFVTAAQALVPKVQTALSAIESRYPDSLAARIVHNQMNTIAIMVEDLTGQARGTLGGVDGTVHPDTGGTGKGGQ